MKALKTLLIGALAMTATAASAQVYEAQDGTKYEFQKYWFFDLEGGAQYTLGEAKFRRLVRPNVQVAIGRQFNPWLGVRLQVNGWQSRGYWDLGLMENGYSAHYPIGYTFNYVAPGLDLMVDLTNLIGGYNPTRVFGLKAFLGGGANIGFDNDELNEHLDKSRHGLTLRNNSLPNTTGHSFEYVWDGTQVLPFGRGGLEASFRLNKCISLLIEGNANILSDKYNSKKTDNADWYFNVLGGLRFNLGNTYTKTLPPPPAPEPVPVVNTTPEPDPAIIELQRQLKELQEKESKVDPLRRDIFFQINKTEIRESEAQKVREIAYYLVKYPNTRVVVTGYADAGTGNDKINDRLAAQRADAVVKALQQQYGIESSRISYDSKGSRVQPFSDNDMNRVSICIAE
ncbi:MAG: OmpA family protein [Prevotella sp.]|nr:OmpA family protein [Prevotella sp.]